MCRVFKSANGHFSGNKNWNYKMFRNNWVVESPIWKPEFKVIKMKIKLQFSHYVRHER